MKRFRIIFFLFLIVTCIVQFPLNSVVAEIQTSGTFYGFDWEYGEETRNFTKSVSYNDSFLESESRTVTRTFTRTVPIRTGLEIQDVFWERWTNRSKFAPNTTWELPGSPQNWRGIHASGFLSNGSGLYGAWFRYEGINGDPKWEVGGQWLFGLADFGGLGWKTNYTQLIIESTNMVQMKDWLGTIHGSISVNSYHIKYIDNKDTLNSDDDETVFEELLIPRYVLVRVQTKL
ncbi:MAG: hypothetical protein ACFFDT_20905, partial [Candidatus Hodarchaeota archaeon]